MRLEQFHTNGCQSLWLLNTVSLIFGLDQSRTRNDGGGVNRNDQKQPKLAICK